MSDIALFTNSTAPGTYVTSSAAAVTSGTAVSTGTAFFVGLSTRGPVATPIQLSGLGDFQTLCGPRTSASSAAYDACEAMFATGVTGAFFSRVVGPAATAATVTLKDQADTPQNTLDVAANGPGTDGNNLAIAVIAGPSDNTFLLQVSYNGAVVETSPPLGSPSDAVNWGTLNPPAVGTIASKYVTITNANSDTAAPNNNPAVAAATSLTGGADDNSNAGDTQFEAAIAVFPADLGPGQVLAPGRTTSATYGALGNHGLANNRFALLDPVIGSDASTVAAAAQSAFDEMTDGSYAMMFANWVLWPGIPTGNATPAWARQVAPSAVGAGLMAANDAVNSANQAAAGNNGQSALALGVVTAFDTADRATLNAAGVSVFRQVRSANNAVQLFGWVTLSSDPRWTDASTARFRMEFTDALYLAAESFDFSQIDGQGHTLSGFAGALTAVCTAYYNAGALYGATPAAAFNVNVAPPVNTAATAGNRQLNAVVNYIDSPSAQWAAINIVKYLTTQTLPAATSATAAVAA